MAFVMINPFEVPTELADQFVREWEELAAFIRVQPGFEGCNLNRAVGSGGRFQYVAIGQWRSQEEFAAALRGATIAPAWLDGRIKMAPALYELIRDCPARTS